MGLSLEEGLGATPGRSLVAGPLPLELQHRFAAGQFELACYWMRSAEGTEFSPLAGCCVTLLVSDRNTSFTSPSNGCKAG